MMKKENKAPNAGQESSEPRVIDSVGTMVSWLESIKGAASPALVQVLQTQISILRTVESPSMIGMTMDNMTECLMAALDKCDEEQKPEIRKSFASMLQNTVFLAEAKLRYAIDKNKKEALQLVEEAGSMLTDTVKQIAGMAVPGGAAKVAISNIMPLVAVQTNLLGKIGVSIRNKKFLEEKQDEFNKTLDNIFVMLDKYQEYYGSSAVINGMVAKYKGQLLDAFVDSKIEPLMGKISAAQVLKISDTIESLVDDLNKASSIILKAGIPLKAGNKLLRGWAIKKATESSIKLFCRYYDAYEERIVELQQKVSEAEQLFSELKLKGKDIGFFSFSGKRESKAKIEEQEEVVSQCKEDLKAAEQKFSQLKNLCPEACNIKKDIDRYECFLNNLEKKYEI